MPSILCIALNPAIDISCEADRVQPTLKTRTRNQTRHAGGGGTNVARVIAELGGRPRLAFLCGGVTGQLYQSLVEEYGIACDGFEVAQPTRIAYAVRDLQTNLEYRFVPEGPSVSEEELEPLMRLVQEFDGDYVVASGSLPKGLPDDTYAQMADAATSRGARFILDTSGAALKTALDRSRMFLIKPSIGELESWAGASLDEEGARDAANRIVQSGAAEHVVVSFGRQGALLANRDGIVRAAGQRVRTVSATGAGDSFVGAMTWWLAQGNPVGDAFRLGLAAGAAASMTPGTELCRRDDVFRLFGDEGRT